MKKSILITVLTIIVTLSPFAPPPFAAGGSIALDQVNNYVWHYIPDWVEADKPLVFHLGIYNNSGFPIMITRGFFEIYSTDGAVWQPIDGSWTTAINWNLYYDGPLLATEYSANGSGADTANFISFNLTGPGLPNLFTATAWSITTQVDASQVGKHLCIDSVKNSRGTLWLWNNAGGNFAPTWTGPHCFEIHADCCQNIRGDVNGDGVDANTLDLTYLVDRIFRGGPPAPCALEADVNGDGTSANVSDLSYLVDIIFRSGPPPPSCP